MASNDDTTAGAIAAPAEEALPTAPLLVAPEQPEYVPAAEVLPAGLDGLVGADPEAGPDAADGAKPFEPLGAITNRP